MSSHYMQFITWSNYFQLTLCEEQFRLKLWKYGNYRFMPSIQSQTASSQAGWRLIRKLVSSQKKRIDSVQSRPSSAMAHIAIIRTNQGRANISLLNLRLNLIRSIVLIIYANSKKRSAPQTQRESLSKGAIERGIISHVLQELGFQYRNRIGAESRSYTHVLQELGFQYPRVQLRV